jgi:hypothetical protein
MFKIESIYPEDRVSLFLQNVVLIHINICHIPGNHNVDIQNSKSFRTHTALRAAVLLQMCGEAEAIVPVFYCPTDVTVLVSPQITLRLNMVCHIPAILSMSEKYLIKIHSTLLVNL